jgi:hypothetical protein
MVLALMLKTGRMLLPGDLNFRTVQPWAAPEKSPSELESSSPMNGRSPIQVMVGSQP